MMGGLSAAFGVVFTYAATSVLFWHYPHLLHKRKKVAFTARHISHRGGSAEGYENTLRSFQNAVLRGTEMLELDVRFTKDKKVVVFHDPDLTRMAGKKVKISDVEFQALPTLSYSVPIDTVPGKCFQDESWTVDERRIPLLSQVLQQFPDVPMNIDIKDADEQLIDEVSELLKKYKRQHLTVWGSFNDSVCQRCYKVDPEVGLFFSAKRAMAVILLAFTGVLSFLPLKETHYEVFLPMALKRRRMEQVGQLTISDKVMLWVSENFLIWKPLISHLQRRGIIVYFWVCNNEEEFIKCQELGADGIMTDYPSKLRQFLDNCDTSSGTK